MASPAGGLIGFLLRPPLPREEIPHSSLSLNRRSNLSPLEVGGRLRGRRQLYQLRRNILSDKPRVSLELNFFFASEKGPLWEGQRAREHSLVSGMKKKGRLEGPRADRKGPSCLLRI